MSFSYYELKTAAEVGIDIGKWKGNTVFSCSKNELKNKGNGAIFIIYDDNNALVKKVSDTWKCLGNVSETGVVTEHDAKTYLIEERTPPYVKEVYCYDTQSYEPAAKAYEEKEEEYEPVAADIKLGLDVDATLKNARTMTIDSLLDGFNYGL